MADPIGEFPPELDELQGLREENRTLYQVIRVVSSSLELSAMLRGVVDLATEATGCHACFIYLLEDEQLTIRAASPVFSEAVDQVRFSVEEGLTGWVARHRTPEFIRDEAMEDPRMKFVPLLQEERFQSMVAVPILSRAGETIGVIVLHTQAPHEFDEDTLKLLMHTASLASGAIENAQLYERERQRAAALTRLSQLAERLVAADGVTELGLAVVDGVRRLVDANAVQLFGVGEDQESLELLASAPATLPSPSVSSITELLLLGASSPGPHQTDLWPAIAQSALLVLPLSADGPVGVLCVASPEDAPFTSAQAEIVRAVAHLTALAIRRAELITALTQQNSIKDLFEALEAGADALVAIKAAEIRLDLTETYVIVRGEPAESTSSDSRAWQTRADRLASGLSELTRRSAIETGPGPFRAVLVIEASQESQVQQRCRELAQDCAAAIGISDVRRYADAAADAYREARAAGTVSHALSSGGGSVAYSEVGAYRYLVHIAPDDAPRDRMAAAVDHLIEYDRRRGAALLETLERYLGERCSAAKTARALYLHPNTMQQRLGRIEKIGALDLRNDDLLSLELAIKVARLHGRANA